MEGAAAIGGYVIGRCKGCGALKLGGGLCRTCEAQVSSEPLAGGAYCQKCERPGVVVTDTVMHGRFYQVLLCKLAKCGTQITRELSEVERGAR